MTRHSYYYIIIVLLCLVFCELIKTTEANPLAFYPSELDKLDRAKLIDDLDFVTDPNNFNETSLITLTTNELLRKFMLAGWRMPVNDITSIHRYDSLEDKLISGGPNVNQDQCNKQLDYLVARSHQHHHSVSAPFTLYNLLDSYGRPQAGLARGAWYWLGDYNQCIQSKFVYNNNYNNDNSSSEQQFVATRYCLASIRWPQWLNTTNFDNDRYTSIKSAICIPQVCDSSLAESNENINKISQLMQVNFGIAHENFTISSIYCLPDQQSPLTDWTQNNEAIAFVLFIVPWLFLITVATLFDLLIGFDHHRRHQKQLRATSDRRNDATSIELEDRPPPRKGHSFAPNQTNCSQARKSLRDSASRAGSKLSDMFMTMLELFSLVRNVKILFNVKPRAKSIIRPRGDQHAGEPIESSLNESIETANARSQLSVPIVDLEYLNGFKSINMLIIALTHLLLLVTLAIHFADAGEMYGRHYFYYLTIAGFCVNNFIHITGMLTTYLLLKRFYTRLDHFWLQPHVWLGFAIHRYLRLIPLWAILVWYVRSLSKYMGSGPLWEYATSNTSRQYYCERETWQHIFLATANFVRPYESCICSGWYLATDLQYAILVTPLFMVLLMKSRFWSIIAGNLIAVALLLKGLAAIAATDYNKPYLNKQTNISTSVFVRELGFAYTEPFYRVGLYIMGLITGYILYMYEESKDSWAMAFVQRLRNSFMSHGITIIIITGMFSFLPIAKLPLDAFLFGSFNMRMFLFAVSIMIQMYLLSIFSIVMATSKNRMVALRRFLSFKMWKIPSRMCLSILLVNPIVIQHFYQLLTQTYQLTYTIQNAIIVTMVFWIYFISMIVFLVLELPLCALADLLHKMM